MNYIIVTSLQQLKGISPFHFSHVLGGVTYTGGIYWYVLLSLHTATEDTLLLPISNLRMKIRRSIEIKASSYLKCGLHLSGKCALCNEYAEYDNEFDDVTRKTH